MHFLTLVVKNLLRRKVRTGLTCAGLAVAVAAVVSLVGVSQGFERSFNDLFLTRGVDVVVFRGGITARITSSIHEGVGDCLRRLPGVKAVTGTLFEVVELPDSDLLGVPAQGWEPGSFMFEQLKLIDGRAFGPGVRGGGDAEVMLGESASRSLNKSVGSVVTVGGKDFKVVGVFRSFNVHENGCILMPMRDLQALMARREHVTGFLVILDDVPDKAALVERLRQRINDLHDEDGEPMGLNAMTAQDHVHTTAEIRFMRGMAWLTSAIALVIGTAGVLNTMMTSVTERTREVGILRAVGWRRGRVVGMILLESLALCAAGAVVGVVVAVSLTWLLSQSQAAGLVAGDIDVKVIGLGLGLALLVGLVGGIVPALHAASITPAQAIRHE